MNVSFKKLFPFLRWFPLTGSGVKADMLAGLTVAFVLIPQSMAYAELAGLPVWMGLYASFLPVILAGLWGSSNHLQTGPGATMALIVSSSLMPLAVAGSQEYAALAVQLGFMVGILWALMVVFRLGFILNFLSRPVIEGFINAGAILIALSQVIKIFGIEGPRTGSLPGDLMAFGGQLSAVNWISVSMGITSLILLLAGRRFFPKIPMALLVAVGFTLVTYVFGLSDAEAHQPLAIVGAIPAGLPGPVWPVPDTGNLYRLMPGALTFALIGFMETFSVARGIAARSHQKLSVNQEAIGQSLAAFGSAFSGGQPVNGSFSRSALNFASGARSGLAAVFTGLFVLVFLLFCTPLFYYLPKTVLAAIIIAAVIKLMNFQQLIAFLKINKADGLAAWVTFAATLVFSPALAKGILAGAAVSILLHLYRMMRPRVAVLGQHADGMLRDADLHQLKIDRLLLAIRLDGRLFFANTSYFEDQVHAALDRFPETRHVAILFNGINEIDSSGTEMLKELHGQLNLMGVSLLFVGVKNNALKVLRSAGIEQAVGEDNFFGTYDHAREAVIARMPSDVSYTI